MNPEIEFLKLIIEGLFVLTVGSYGYTFIVSKMLAGRIQRILSNHLAHIDFQLQKHETRLTDLERGDGE